MPNFEGNGGPNGSSAILNRIVQGPRYEHIAQLAARTGFEKAEQRFIAEVAARSGLPTQNVWSIRVYDSIRAMTQTGLVLDPFGTYDSSNGQVQFLRKIFAPTSTKIYFNGRQHVMLWSAAETIMHELAHACSPAMHPDTHYTIAANKRRYYGSEAKRKEFLNLLEKISNGYISKRRQINDYHALNASYYQHKRMTRDSYLDEVFAILVQHIFSYKNFLYYEVQRGNIDRADADQLAETLRTVIGCDVATFNTRVAMTIDLSAREADYFVAAGTAVGLAA